MPIKVDRVPARAQGARLKQLREFRGLTQEALGKLTGLSRGQVGHYESGRALPNSNTLAKYSLALNISIEIKQGQVIINPYNKQRIT